MSKRTLTVELGEGRSYPIYIGAHLLNESENIIPFVRGKQVFIVTNETVEALYLERLRSLLEGSFKIDVVVLPDGEQYKTNEYLMKVYDGLLSCRHNRTTTLIALGGGVVGDMTGFAAACYQRGVNFIQVPTTLLSQVDSSVGGKTGVNHPLGKNMIGAFHQPQVVVIDTEVLKTLPPRELSAGMAEVIKYGLICDKVFYQWLQDHMEQLMALDDELITEAIARSCQSKADVVSQDEREGGIRAILNLGHTFGHAIEAEQGYGNWLHGEAVATGMLIAADLSARVGWISVAEVDELRELLLKANLPISIPDGMSAESFLKHMSVDKKVIDGRLRLILLKSIGEAVITDEIPTEKIVESIEACRANC